MSITVTCSTIDQFPLVAPAGLYGKRGTLTIGGLSVGDNVVPHGLVQAPQQLSYRAGWCETAPPDQTNLHITVLAGQPTSGRIDFEYVGW